MLLATCLHTAALVASGAVGLVAIAFGLNAAGRNLIGYNTRSRLIVSSAVGACTATLASLLLFIVGGGPGFVSFIPAGALSLLLIWLGFCLLPFNLRRNAGIQLKWALWTLALGAGVGLAMSLADLAFQLSSLS
jgi:hypothetical protein